MKIGNPEEQVRLRELLGKHMDITHVMEQQLTAPPGLQPPPK